MGTPRHFGLAPSDDALDRIVKQAAERVQRTVERALKRRLSPTTQGEKTNG